MMNDVSQTLQVVPGRSHGVSDGARVSLPSRAQSTAASGQQVAAPREAEAVDPKASEAAGNVRQQLEEVAGRLNEFVRQVHRKLQFSVDETSGQTVITVMDAETEETIRQIPPEEVLTLARRLGEVQGILFRSEA